MQIGEQRLAAPHARVLDRHGLLDLEHQVGVGPDVFCGGDQLRARGFEIAVGDRRAFARARLDQDLVAATGQLGDAGRGDRHPELVVFGFGRDADTHDRQL